MLREQTVVIVSQCQLRYENSTKKIVFSFPESCESAAQITPGEPHTWLTWRAVPLKTRSMGTIPFEWPFVPEM
jgi:hypothetical protein